jgi:serine-type D-Ala-D-Ala carboxypeptidase/endopeptidase (penicillin-binding protein 4)
VLDTGSGLSYETQFSARQVVDVLRAGAGYTGRVRPPLTEEGVRVASAGTTALANMARDVHATLGPSADEIHPVWMRGRDPEPESFLSSLPVAGRDGTLARRFRSSEVRDRMFAKTGTLRDIIALSGFLTDTDDNQLAFAIVTNDHRTGLRTAVRDEQGRMVEAIYRYLRARRGERRDVPPGES